MTTRAPKPPRKAPTTRWGRFLVAERLKRGWFQKDAFKHFRDKFGWAEDSRASYGNWERGTAEPSGEVAIAILAEYGYEELPPDTVTAEAAPTDPMTRLAEAIETQNALMASALGLLSQGVAMSPKARKEMDDWLALVKAQSTSRLPAFHPTG